jgi:hypothetical protein
LRKVNHRGAEENLLGGLDLRALGYTCAKHMPGNRGAALVFLRVGGLGTWAAPAFFSRGRVGWARGRDLKLQRSRIVTCVDKGWCGW